MLAVAMKLDLGSKRYTTHASRLRLVRSRLPDLDRLEIDLPAGVSLDAGPGDDVKLALDGGEGEETVFTGALQRVIGGAAVVHLVAGGASFKLAAARPALALESLTTGQVIQQLCDDAGVETDVLDNGPSLALYLADGRATAMQEIARLSAVFGGFARVDGKGRLSAGASLGQTRGLRYGREPLAVASASGEPPEISITATGPFAASSGEEGAREPVADFARGSAPASAFAWRRTLAGLGDVDDARAAAAAVVSRRSSAWKPFCLRTWLIPAWEPLDRLTLQDSPQRAGIDEALVTRVIHCIEGAGAWTELRGFAASSNGASLLSALGGLP